MIITRENTVAEIVTDDIRTADVFKKYNIDFCCGGGISIQKACEKQGLNFEIIEEEINDLGKRKVQAHDFNSWELDFLIDYIQNVHHTYVNENMPLLLQYANKVAHVHGAHFTETIRINQLVIDVVAELTAHMKKEELILFPFIKKLLYTKRTGETRFESYFGSVNNPIKMMEREHENAGDAFKSIAKLTRKYTPPAEACNTFKALYAKLDEFEQDLHQHIHLENNILFPKARDLEKKLNLESNV